MVIQVAHCLCGVEYIQSTPYFNLCLNCYASLAFSVKLSLPLPEVPLAENRSIPWYGYIENNGCRRPIVIR